jgi:hypothetical protein
MLVAQALVESGMIDTVVSAVSSGVEQAVYYVRAGNAKWFLIGLAIVMAILLFKPKR